MTESAASNTLLKMMHGHLELELYILDISFFRCNESIFRSSAGAISPRRGLKIEQGRKARGVPRLGGPRYSSLAANLCMQLHAGPGRENVRKGIPFQLLVLFPLMEEKRCVDVGLVSAPTAAANKSGAGDVPPCMYTAVVYGGGRGWMHTVNLSHS